MIRKWLKNRWFSGLLALLFCLFTLAMLFYTGILWPNSLFVSDYRVRGLDVSSYQKLIDWEKVVQTGEYQFVFIKATEGKNYKDAYFQKNWLGTKKQGLLRGAYHFFREYRTATEQADNYISLVPKEVGMLPPVLDLEVSGKDRKKTIQEIKTFLNRLEQHDAMKPIIYADHTRYTEYIQGNFEDHPIWIRDILTPVQWSAVKNWTFWQYCNRGHVPGISGFVDLNVFSGNRDQLNKLVS